MIKATDARPGPTSAQDPRARIISAGVRLVARQGTAAATTRAIAAEASVQAPTIFRHFGDKNGLLDAIAAQTMADFLASGPKTASTDDPVRDLRAGMEAFMGFGIANPDVFLHMYARPGVQSEPVKDGYRALQERIRRVALAGRLAVSEERACDVLHALARGTVFEMLDKAAAERGAMIETASSVALNTILNDSPTGQGTPAGASASTLRAHLNDLDFLSPGERLLMDEVLGRIADRR